MIDGAKMFITNAGTEITACVTITAPHRRRRDLHHHRPERHARLRASAAAATRWAGTRSDTRELTFSGCRVPAGTPARAPAATAFASSSRSSTAAASAVAALGARASPRARSSWHSSYAREREQFGQPIGRFQAIQFKLADMATEIEARAQPGLQGGLAEGRGPRRSRRRRRWPSSTPGELARRVANESLQIHGGYGFMDEYPDLALLPRREDPRDRRGHERDPARS